jgi:hypothetical protein
MVSTLPPVKLKRPAGGSGIQTPLTQADPHRNYPPIKPAPVLHNIHTTDVGSQKSYSFTQAMSRLLNAIQMCQTERTPPLTPQQQPPSQQPPQGIPQQQQQQGKRPHQTLTQYPQQQPLGRTPMMSHILPHGMGSFPARPQPEPQPPHHGPPQVSSAYSHFPPPNPGGISSPTSGAPIISRPVPASAFPALQQAGRSSSPPSQDKYASVDAHQSAFKTLPPRGGSMVTTHTDMSHHSTTTTTTTTLSSRGNSSSNRHQDCQVVYKNTYVFIVAVDRPADQRLAPRPGASDGVRQIEALLRSSMPTFHVRTILNEQATKENIRMTFLADMANAGPSDRVLIFFSGQGLIARTLQGDQVGLLCAYETDTSDSLGTGILPAEILGWIPHARHLALFLDCPFAGIGLPLFGGETPMPSTSWQPFLHKLAAQYLWSGNIFPPLTHSLTHALTHSLSMLR